MFRIVSCHNANCKTLLAYQKFYREWDRISFIHPFVASTLLRGRGEGGGWGEGYLTYESLIETTGFRSRSMRRVSIVRNDSWTHRVTSFIGFISLGWSIFMNRPMIGHVCLGGACWWPPTTRPPLDTVTIISFPRVRAVLLLHARVIRKLQDNLTINFFSAQIRKFSGRLIASLTPILRNIILTISSRRHYRCRFLRAIKANDTRLMPKIPSAIAARKSRSRKQDSRETLRSFVR